MAHLTKVASLAASILQQMPDVGRWQTKFLIHLFVLWLSIRGRYNFTHLSRYGKFKESTYRNNFAKSFGWLEFNTKLVESHFSLDRIITFDPCYISKSGKHSFGVDHFWSGVAGQAKWGQEFCGFAAVDLPTKTALHLVAIQTASGMADSLLDYYATAVETNIDQLTQISDCLVVDAYFSKAPFVDRMVKAGLDVITRLRTDQVMMYPYFGPREHRRGAPKKYDGKVDPFHLKDSHFVVCAGDKKERWIAYEAVLYVKAWKRKAKIVIVHKLDKEGNVIGYFIIASTNLQLSGAEILYRYKARFQQEFLYRDAKQELGLDHCQAYSWSKIDFHLNTALTVGNLAKAAHHIKESEDSDSPFSIADVKTRYFNQSMFYRIIRGSRICPNLPIIRNLLPKIRDLGLRRA